jgi:hypothetical protein
MTRYISTKKQINEKKRISKKNKERSMLGNRKNAELWRLISANI